MLLKMRIADYPNMEREDKRVYHREIYRMAYPREESREVVTTKELAQRLKVAMNGK